MDLQNLTAVLHNIGMTLNQEHDTTKKRMPPKRRGGILKSVASVLWEIFVAVVSIAVSLLFAGFIIWGMSDPWMGTYTPPRDVDMTPKCVIFYDNETGMMVEGGNIEELWLDENGERCVAFTSAITGEIVTLSPAKLDGTEAVFWANKFKEAEK